ncbi:MAG: hypothetical protein PHS94_06630 [Erysipelotrichaceae bacterium]|nr:hypothetical protein [Erysipelotrichaceae bacterium]
MDKNKFKNIPFSLLLNLAATFIVALVANLVAIAGYYRITPFAGLARLFFDNIYTAGYFVLLWLMNFVIFEAVNEIFEHVSKIRTIAIFNHKIPGVMLAGFVVTVAVLALDPPAVFKSNFIILAAWVMIYDWLEYKHIIQGGR